MSRPRIRTIKPELWHSRDFQALSPLGRLTFISLMSNADDEGRLATDSSHIASAYMFGCLPDEIAVQLERMEDRHMVVTYRRRGARFIAILDYTGEAAWSQRIDHPKMSELPAPPKFKRSGSPNNGQLELDSLANARERSRSNGPDRKGSDRTVSDRTVLATGVAGALTVPASLTALEQVFLAWQQRWHPTAKLTTDRRAKIQARLREGWSVEDLVLAVTDGAAADPWGDRHVALNDDLTHLLRTGGAVEKFLGLARAPLAQRMPASTSRASQLDRIYAEAQERARQEGR